MSGSLEPLAAADGWPPFLCHGLMRPGAGPSVCPLNYPGLFRPAGHAGIVNMHEPESWQPLPPPEEGQAVCFSFRIAGQEEQAFVICHKGRYYAYRNQCPHAGTPLDWLPGQFFSVDRQYLVCQTHGAHFAPDSGDVVWGPSPCGLDRLPVRKADGVVEVPESYAKPPWC